jgi:hypothetical protein
MTVAVALIAPRDADPAAVHAQIVFHRAAGAAQVLVDGEDGADDVRSVVAHHSDDGVHAVTAAGGGMSHERIAGAAAELGADWVIHVAKGEFWWPRAASLDEVLAPVPPRYSTVRGIVRRFLPLPGQGPSWRRLVVREAFAPSELARRSLEDALRPVYRTSWRPGRAEVPLRACYPLEVLTLPAGAEDPGDLRDAAVARGLADGSLATDARLADAFEAIDRGVHPDFRAPDVVDEAAFAVESAALGEVDTEGLTRQLDELEARLAQLEGGLGVRVTRRLQRLARGARR